ncbi:MAG TPA: lasso peptide biosynthesis B2 protein [Sphingomicrobium sp.]|jgi:hypothetical protein
MSISLAPNIFYTLSDDRAIFLDLRGDRYFALDAPHGSAIRLLLSGHSGGDVADAAIARLVARGVLISGGSAGPPRAADVPVARQSALESADGRPALSMATALEVALCCARIARRLQTRPLLEIIEALRLRRDDARRRAGQSTSHRAIEATRLFAAHRPFVPGRPVCLSNSLALLLYLTKHGIAADLVFAVQIHPFLAHCWLQTDHILLNEGVGHAAALQPIAIL